MIEEDSKLYDLVDISDPIAVLREIEHTILSMFSDYDFSGLEVLYRDIIRLFKGDYPGYRASNTKYHDLEHTSAVALAVTRLMHGCHLDGVVMQRSNIILGVGAALFHDVGLIQTENDRVGSGAKYTVGHEQRSIAFMRRYLSEKGVIQTGIEDCSHMIMCTILNLPVADIPFRNEASKVLGKFVGAADLLAQISDRYYLEKLLLLYKEFEEAGIPGFNTEFDLLRKTEAFYKNVAQKRLTHDLGGIGKHMRSHFKFRWGLERDLYKESIEQNIAYLTSILEEPEDTLTVFRNNLRRGGITGRILSGESGNDEPEH
jgi:hypothetical protein